MKIIETLTSEKEKEIWNKDLDIAFQKYKALENKWALETAVDKKYKSSN